MLPKCRNFAKSGHTEHGVQGSRAKTEGQTIKVFTRQSTAIER